MENTPSWWRVHWISVGVCMHIGCCNQVVRSVWCAVQEWVTNARAVVREQVRDGFASIERCEVEGVARQRKIGVLIR